MSGTPTPGAVWIGDVLDFAAQLTPASVQALITSPPYFGQRDYQVAPTAWAAVDYAPLAGLPPLTIPPLVCALGLEPTPEAFVGHLVAIFRALRPALRRDGTLWINLGDSYNAYNGNRGTGSLYAGDRAEREPSFPTGHGLQVKTLAQKDLIGIPWRVAFALQADGWVLRSDIVWSKNSPMPESVRDRPTKSHEYFFVLANNPRAYYYDAAAIREPAATYARKGGTAPSTAGGNTTNGIGSRSLHQMSADGRNRRSVWRISSVPFKGAHFATMPPALVRPALLAATSAAGECPACGAPWQRVEERATTNLRPARRGNARGANYMPGERHVSDLQAIHNTNGQTLTHASATLRWEASCRCDAGDPIPQIALDPFLGSGTLAQVATEEGRRWLGCDLDGRAVDWTATRLAALQRRLALPLALTTPRPRREVAS